MSRAAYRPTAKQRGDVCLMKADGWSDDRIARLLGISRPTLLKYFMVELEQGADRVRAEQFANLRRMAKRGNAGAARMLLQLLGVNPSSTGAASTEDDTKLGKKEIAQRDAQQAERGTSWDGILKH